MRKYITASSRNQFGTSNRNFTDRNQNIADPSELQKKSMLNLYYRHLKQFLNKLPNQFLNGLTAKTTS